MTRTAQQSRAMQAANDLARGSIWPSDNDLLAKRAFQVGLARGLMLNLLSAADAPEDIREQAINLAVAQIRREFGATGRLSA